ncbi:PH domain-containing protein [Halorubrum distributum]|uniref:PH domain-containing protein n=1 Tax=Halorubrum distributum TaxID=29283 RepID=UPI0012691DA2|nr:PH domain-containing protein [Halorubrum terrestre]
MSDSDMSIRELAEAVADTAHHSSVKRFYLDNSRGILNSTPPVSLLWEDESVQFIFHNAKEGLEGTFDGVEDYKPSESRGTLLVVTDERVLILLGKEQRDLALCIPYGSIEATAFDASLLGAHWLGFAGVSRIHLDTSEGRYTVPIIKATRGDVKRVTRHIETYCEEANDGMIREFEPEIDYQPPRETSRPEYKTILACRKCLAEVSRGVERCPHCGFDPQENTRGATWKVGALGLSMTVLAPLGLAMGYDSVSKTRDAAKGVWIEKTVEVDDSE